MEKALLFCGLHIKLPGAEKKSDFEEGKTVYVGNKFKINTTHKNKTPFPIEIK